MASTQNPCAYIQYAVLSQFAHKTASLPFLPSFPSSFALVIVLSILELLPFTSPIWFLWSPPPTLVALSGVSACEASALQYILLIGSILCIITPSCLWVQLAQSGPSVDPLPDDWGLAPHDPSLSKSFASRKR